MQWNIYGNVFKRASILPQPLIRVFADAMKSNVETNRTIWYSKCRDVTRDLLGY